MAARIVRVLLLMLTGLFVVVACGTSDDTSTGQSGAAAGSLAPGTVVIDVRTPEEYAAGHLQGARNIDVSSPTFVEMISTLPTDDPYVVYCRTGNRSAQAVAIMRSQGFTDVTDAGGIDEAQASTGLQVQSE
ncbi:rhodanese-like domain-containing protein [Gordonia rhizosphera]|nr:rhodanese-like domain-containing protein [Gordonia rhizosphera]